MTKLKTELYNIIEASDYENFVHVLLGILFLNLILKSFCNWCYHHILQKICCKYMDHQMNSSIDQTFDHCEVESSVFFILLISNIYHWYLCFCYPWICTNYSLSLNKKFSMFLFKISIRFQSTRFIIRFFRMNYCFLFLDKFVSSSFHIQPFKSYIIQNNGWSLNEKQGRVRDPNESHQ